MNSREWRNNLPLSFSTSSTCPYKWLTLINHYPREAETWDCFPNHNPVLSHLTTACKVPLPPMTGSWNLHKVPSMKRLGCREERQSDPYLFHLLGEEAGAGLEGSSKSQCFFNSSGFELLPLLISPSRKTLSPTG